jgi:hypothetical protein
MFDSVPYVIADFFIIATIVKCFIAETVATRTIARYVARVSL